MRLHPFARARVNHLRMFTGKMTGRLFRGRRRGAETAAPRSTVPLEQRWDDAFLRVESYLHAHGIQSPLVVSRIAGQVMAEARRVAATVAEPPPVTLAMAALQNAMTTWYREIFSEPETSDEAIRSKGRLALVMTRQKSGWAQQFLEADLIQPRLAAGLRGAQLHPGPEVKFTNMPPAPLEFMINPREQSDSPSTRRQGLLQMAALWILILGGIGAAWAASH
jgi:hypothetical protein